MSKKLIDAVVYLRKSTKGTRPDGSERQEKSITQQRTEIETLARGQYRIIREYADEGVSGWKRNGKRPDFDRMLRDAKERADFSVILCDDLDRFSRAEVLEVFADLSSLAAAGVKTIHCVNQGVYSYSQDSIGEIIKMVVDVHGGNEFSRKLSRRVTLAHRNRAKEGKRAGVAPYGMRNDGNGGLVHGNRKHLAIVRRIFERFATRKESMNGIASALNAEGIPAPRGGKWHVAGIKELLQRPAYRGDFVFGRRQQGRFSTIANDGEVVQSTDELKRWKSREPVFRTRRAYTPVVPVKLWDAAQQRLASFELKGSRRPRSDGYPLTGILYCAHCGKPMYGCQPTGRKYRVYRCSTTAKTGVGSCPSGGTPEIREDRILPVVLNHLSAGVADICKLLTAPPEELTAFTRRHEEKPVQVLELERECAGLQRKIANARSAMYESDDASTRREIEADIKALRAHLEPLQIELTQLTENATRKVRLNGKLYNADALPNRTELQALADWWEDFSKRAVSVPLNGQSLTANASFYQDPFSETGALLVDARVVNETLHSLDSKVNLLWERHLVTRRTGLQVPRFKLVGGDFDIAGQVGRLKPGKSDGSFYKAMVGVPCSGSRVAGRCDSRRGTG